MYYESFRSRIYVTFLIFRSLCYDNVNYLLIFMLLKIVVKRIFYKLRIISFSAILHEARSHLNISTNRPVYMLTSIFQQRMSNSWWITARKQKSEQKDLKGSK